MANEKEFATAVILRRTVDYYNQKDEDKFLDFCLNSIWFDFVNIDRKKFYEKAVKKKKELNKYGKTKIKKYTQTWYEENVEKAFEPKKCKVIKTNKKTYCYY